MSRATYALAPALALAIVVVVAACSHAKGGPSGACASPGDPPGDLVCTGLYADFATKNIADGVRAYAPAEPLWADGADKQRWIQLPPGATIDASTPNEWTFPVGTKVWKEFSVGGRRVETRYFEKTQPRFWVYATYVWSADESSASRSFGTDLMLPGGAAYHVPGPDECDQCHRGRADRLLGFEQASLGLPGASGFALAQLVAEGRLSPAPSQVDLKIGDDGTGAAEAALRWIHVNCGVSCHNDDSNSTGYGAGMRLRLDATLLDGRSSAGFDVRSTTVAVAAKSAGYDGQLRIAPGDPAHSLIVQLASLRGPADQMPPIATRVADQAGIDALTLWIRRMAEPPPEDGGPPPPADSGADAGGDAGSHDAGEGHDGAIEASTDGSIEAGLDATDDAADDAGVDAAADTAPDVAPDAAAD